MRPHAKLASPCGVNCSSTSSARSASSPYICRAVAKEAEWRGASAGRIGKSPHPLVQPAVHTSAVQKEGQSRLCAETNTAGMLGSLHCPGTALLTTPVASPPVGWGCRSGWRMQS